MSESMTVELTEKQRDLVLRGLRYVRNSIMLEVRDPSPEFIQDRERRLQEVHELITRLETAKTNSTADVR